MADLNYSSMESPLGTLHLLASDTALCALAFDTNWPDIRGGFATTRVTEVPLGSHVILNPTHIQLHEYFAGQRSTFELPLHFEGTPFQKSAWGALLKIPYGQTWTYSQQAEFIGRPAAVRAVGHANGLNRLCIVVPCHRVIGKSGTISGYAGGTSVKAALLRIEKPR